MGSDNCRLTQRLQSITSATIHIVCGFSGTVCFWAHRSVRLLNTPKGSLKWISGPFISRLLKGSIMIVLEIVSVVFILFVILWAFKLIIDSFDEKNAYLWHRNTAGTQG